MRAYSHRYRVFFLDGSSREVLDRSEEGAKQTASAAQKLVGFKGAATKAVSVEEMWHSGTGAEHCPICQAKRKDGSDAVVEVAVRVEPGGRPAPGERRPRGGHDGRD